ALSVVMIHLIGSLFKVDLLTIYVIKASFVSLIGIYALSGASFYNFTIGYLWSVIGALMYAVSVVYQSYETRTDHRSE
ncbi:EamA/RhaT family transporter, partial [Francisella tularensis subsp. holarctica]|nr:EamA/RhaT family transporter [Francisella tularensis subsp. holarctica]